MAVLRYWDGSKWVDLAGGTPPEVWVGSSAPSPRTAELLWVDTAAATPGVRVERQGGYGPWPVDYTVNVPFKADVLVVVTATVFATASGMNGPRLLLDGTVAVWGDYFFNEPNSHKLCSIMACHRGVSAGNHVWRIDHGYAATTSDANDRSQLAFTMVQVP
jgi:hypothetical protein